MRRLTAAALAALALLASGCNRSSDPPDLSPTAGVDQGAGDASDAAS